MSRQEEEEKEEGKEEEKTLPRNHPEIQIVGLNSASGEN